MNVTKSLVPPSQTVGRACARAFRFRLPSAVESTSVVRGGGVSCVDVWVATEDCARGTELYSQHTRFLRHILAFLKLVTMSMTHSRSRTPSRTQCLSLTHTLYSHTPTVARAPTLIPRTASLSPGLPAPPPLTQTLTHAAAALTASMIINATPLLNRRVEWRACQLARFSLDFASICIMIKVVLVPTQQGPLLPRATNLAQVQRGCWRLNPYPHTKSLRR